jgi:hypothetical protein
MEIILIEIVSKFDKLKLNKIYYYTKNYWIVKSDSTTESHYQIQVYEKL